MGFAPKSYAIRAGVPIGIFWGLATLVLLYRLYVRFSARAHGLDDLALFVSWVFACAMASCMAVEINYGLGFPSLINAITDVTQGLMYYFYFSMIFYHATLGFTKLAILLQYRRVFTLPRFLFWNTVFIAIIVAYTTAAIGVSIGICRPVRKFWWVEYPVKGFCINMAAFWYSSAAFNIVSDLAIIYMPYRVIDSLHLPTKDRRMLMGVFCFGGIVTVFSATRIPFARNVALWEDPPAENLYLAIFSAIEVFLAIVCACLPPLRSLFKWLPWGLSTTASSSAPNRVWAPRYGNPQGSHFGTGSTRNILGQGSGAGSRTTVTSAGGSEIELQDMGGVQAHTVV